MQIDMPSPNPSSSVTFLFTDIEGSTELWEHHHEAMQSALARHDVCLRGAIEAHGGSWDNTEGDARAVYRDVEVPGNRYVLFGFRVRGAVPIP